MTISPAFMTELTNIATTAGIDSLDDLAFDFLNGDLAPDVMTAVVKSFRTHWSDTDYMGGCGDDAIDDFRMELAVNDAVRVLIARYTSGQHAFNAIVHGSAPDDDADTMDAWDTIHTAYDVDDTAERSALAPLFGVDPANA